MQALELIRRWERWSLAYLDRHDRLVLCAGLCLLGALWPSPAAAQPIGIPAYTTAVLDSPEVVLVTPAGRFEIQLGLGCEDLIVGQNVELLPGSGGVASIASPGSTYLCNVQVESRLSEDPCRTDDAGACDVRFDYAEVE